MTSNPFRMKLHYVLISVKTNLWSLTMMSYNIFIGTNCYFRSVGYRYIWRLYGIVVAGYPGFQDESVPMVLLFPAKGIHGRKGPSFIWDHVGVFMIMNCVSNEHTSRLVMHILYGVVSSVVC
ncbi:uncharacterized protein [Rutidosis leptorrhynchoides]|uniref:uncharacterized protein n=1 Tax=Rutidosis leptorrhynchoides TaxID=125765 RepID=UPI003A9949F0